MKPTIHLSLLLMVLQVHNGHGGKDPVQEKLVSSIADFAFRFSKHITSCQGARNSFFSPLSISMAFSSLGMGAKSNTQKQIYRGLGLAKMDPSKIHKGFQQLLKELASSKHAGKVHVGNALYIAKAVKIDSTYYKDIQNLYQSESFSVNFKDAAVAEKQINDYVKKKTRGKIGEVVKSLDPESIMILVNYIYFKDEWRDPFYPQSTRKKDFFVDEKTTVKVDMMQKNGYFRYFRDEALSCSVLELPYRAAAVAWFILPDKGKLKKVEDGLRGETLSKWRTSLKGGNEVFVSMPKLSMATSYDLKDLLSRLGISEVFTDKADLSGISRDHKLKIDTATHKAVLGVNESGTEAVAVTITNPGVGAAPGPPPIPMEFNRSYFLIILASVDGPMLFMVKVVNPVQP